MASARQSPRGCAPARSHGWHLGDHGYWTKHTNYEEANRIPLLLAGPGISGRGGVSLQLAETVDIYPTLPELAGRPAPAGPQPLDGVSLVPVLRDPAQTVRDHACHCFPRGGRMGRAIRPERHRLVEWKRRGAPPETADLELYDYASDPLETRNVAGEQPETVAGLRTILARHPEAKCGLDFGEPSMNGAAQHVVGANSPSPTHGSSVNPVRRLVRLRPRNFLFANPESISG